MKCAEIRLLLEDYEDGLLDERTAALVEEHLAACEACSAELEEIRTYKKELLSLERVKPPDDFLQRVRERIERPPGWKRFLGILSGAGGVRMPLQLAGFAVAAIAVVFVFNVIRPDMQKRPGALRKDAVTEKRMEGPAEKAVRPEVREKDEAEAEATPGADLEKSGTGIPEKAEAEVPTEAHRKEETVPAEEPVKAEAVFPPEETERKMESAPVLQTAAGSEVLTVMLAVYPAAREGEAGRADFRARKSLPVSGDRVSDLCTNDERDESEEMSPAGPEDDTLDAIEYGVRDLSGTVLSSDENRMLIEVPADRVGDLFALLEKYGKTSKPDFDPMGLEKVRISIMLVGRE